jgi:hypothetical protein
LANCQRSYWCITGVNDTGNACIAGVNDTGEDIDTGKVGDLYCPVSTTPVMHDVTGVNDAGKKCIAGVVDTGVIGCCWVSLTPANTSFASVNDTGE